MSDIKLILFDLDGVLVDACDWHWISLNGALKEICNFELSYEEHMKTFNALPTSKKLETLVAQNRISTIDVDRIWELKQKNTYETIEKHAEIDYDKIELMKELKSRNFKIGCVTNSIRTSAELMLKKTGQFEYIDYLVSNNDMDEPKPAPDGYNQAMSYFNISEMHTLIVEDSDRGYTAAVLSGAHVMRVKDSYEVTTENINKHTRNCEYINTHGRRGK
jgi:beta-phosphoglucomutase